MPEPSSPFDDTAEEPPRPNRKRKPWWRWNVVALFLALFVLVWVREVLGLSPGVTWGMAFIVFAAWSLVPVSSLAFSTPARPKGARMPATNQPTAPGAQPHLDARNGFLNVISVFAIVLFCLASLHLVFTLLWAIYMSFSMFNDPYMGRARSSGEFWVYLVWLVALPLFEMALACALYCLSTIAIRLGYRTPEVADEN